MIGKTLNQSRRHSLRHVWISGFLIFCSAFLITIEVLLRKSSNIRRGGADELSRYALDVASILGLAYAAQVLSQIFAALALFTAV